MHDGPVNPINLVLAELINRQCLLGDFLLEQLEIRFLKLLGRVIRDDQECVSEQIEVDPSDAADEVLKGDLVEFHTSILVARDE